MRLIERVAYRLAYEHRRRTIQNFHRLYYEAPRLTWKNTRWLSVNAFKSPLDLWIYQELIVSLRPQLVIETGTAHGGSALFLATVCDAVGAGEILSIDIESREGRPSHDRITYLNGSSIAPETMRVVAERATGKAPVLVILDSDHSYEHVLAELRHYADLVSPGSYLVVEDTNLNGHPVLPNFGSGPMEAVQEFLRERDDFKPDTEQEKFLLSFNPSGYLRRRSIVTVAHREATRSAHSHVGETAEEERSRRPPRIAAAVAVLGILFVGLPEIFADRPYDPKPSAWPEVMEHV